MKKLPARKCVICGKKFTPKTANAIACSDKCRKANKRRVEKLREAKVAKAKAKKPVLKEKIVLPKKPAKPIVKKPTKEDINNLDTFISVRSKNPFKLAVLSAIICANAIAECLATNKVIFK